jgi:glycine hydroxymethyltransferase
MSHYWEEFFGADLAEVDPAVARLIALEQERQARRIILIPSESIAPAPVRAALGSVFNNIYAEGYPPRSLLLADEAEILDFDKQLTSYRRLGDRRFYKGADYVNLVEALAQRRCAALFGNDMVPPEELFVNVQPLSGAAANLAVYDALLQPGELLMGMDLFTGGHLTHGSIYNISGRRYRVASYGVGQDGRLDYDAILRQAMEVRPKLIIAGYTSYPWAPDWRRFREIADACGAYLMADIAHPAGLVAAGVYPSPVGYADVITFTTHKTICGPRGAVIITADEALAAKIDAAVFPGAQGGPHPNKFAAMAVAFHIAKSSAFREMMARVVQNAKALAESLVKRGIPLAYGGTDTHLLVVDLRKLGGAGQEQLRGEPAVRIMELAGLVANKNTIPGDTATALGSGVRLGTPWVTQRGMGPEEMDIIADCIARLLKGIRPYTYEGLRGPVPRGKIALELLEEVKADVAALAERAWAEPGPRGSDYPHYFFLRANATHEKRGLLLVSGSRALDHLQEVVTTNVFSLPTAAPAPTLLLEPDGRVLDAAVLLRLPDGPEGHRVLLCTSPARHERVKAWLRSLSDGYVLFDADLHKKISGPVIVKDLDEDECPAELVCEGERLRASCQPPRIEPGEPGAQALREQPELIDLTKPYFIGQSALPRLERGVPPEFAWQPEKDASPQRTPLYEEHCRLRARFTEFAGWEMPLWYTSVSEEHRAVRQAAGLFDVGHMGIFLVSGPHAMQFLDLVSTNFVHKLKPGTSQYSYLLDPDGQVLDDIMIYRLDGGDYLLVVNAANAAKDWAWLNAVNEARVLIDRERPEKVSPVTATIADLKSPGAGAAQCLDLALQGPASLRILQELLPNEPARRKLARLHRTELVRLRLAGVDAIVARTGYTGEEFGYEIFVGASDAVALWRALLIAGEPHGLRPCGLAARDAARTEAGLPLYGHELAGPLGISPHEAGFGAYVKFHKPFFVGREPALRAAQASKRQLVRFRVDESGVRPLRGGEPVYNKRGQFVGHVTSCTAIGGEQVGMALVDSRHTQPGTPLAIIPAGVAQESASSSATIALPIWARVVPRFLERERSK